MNVDAHKKYHESPQKYKQENKPKQQESKH